MKKIEHVAVVGAGIMGGHLAAFFANMGISCDIYDINTAIIKKTLKAISSPKTRPPVLYSPRLAKNICGRHSDEMEKRLNKADMIIEAVPEILGLKKKIFQQVDRFRREDSVVATNTSGLSINKMIEGLSDGLSSHFIGTHYFNPVRFLPLVELIPAKTTKPEIIELLNTFFEKADKKVVVCQDTPNFIANRIGIFSLMKSLHLMEKYGFDVETIDMITGTPLGNPKTATLRLSDMVGIDTIVEVARNVYENCPNDEHRDMFQPPALLEKMVEQKMLGEKTGKGFYYRTPEKKIMALDIASFEYRSKIKVKSNVVKIAKGYQNAANRTLAMCDGDTAIHKFCKEIVLSSAAYSLNRVGEITDEIKTIDDAMRWGFRREIGPIESLDAIGLDRARNWMQSLNIAIPTLLDEMIEKTGCVRRTTPTSHFYYSVKEKKLKEQVAPANSISLRVLKGQNKVVRENLSSRLIDLGDSVLLFELDHKMVPSMNPVDDFVLSMFSHIPDVMSKGNYKALVVGNQAEHFCAGAQLQMILELIKAKQWQFIEIASQNFQMATMSLYHADFPVVIAPHGMTLGGGMEITLSGHKRVVHSEFYGGLVEVGVGLLPGGAGNLLLMMQFMDAMASMNPGPMPASTKAFELIAFGAVSNSAHDAMDKGLLRRDDIVVGKQEQIARAKETALSMVDSHQARPLRDLYLGGSGGYMAVENMIDDLVTSGKITEHSAVIAKKQAYVLTGGSNASITTPISEEDFLALEREAFVQLCREKKSQERIAYMLKNKKPLIN